uniref:EF-hand domain-containing protein n=1 Tax=viral metagenome TaxID=1070528 RepID=A0A6C0DKF6_9ZZZZ
MSSTEEQTGIRLSTLNPQVREKLIKFDTKNDGELSIEEAIQGLVALQKQSNNYKKVIYILGPIMILMIASIFGVNMLALKLTKDLQSTSSDSVNVLTNKAGDVLATSYYTEKINFIDWLNNKYSSSIETIKFGELKLDVNGVYLDREYNVSRLYVSTSLLYFYIGNDMTFDIGYNPGNENNIFAKQAYAIIESQLSNIVQTFNTYVSKDVTNDVVVVTRQPRRAYGCGVIATLC